VNEGYPISKLDAQALSIFIEQELTHLHAFKSSQLNLQRCRMIIFKLKRDPDISAWLTKNSHLTDISIVAIAENAFTAALANP